LIADKLENAGKYEFQNRRIHDAFDFLNKTDLKNLEAGRHKIDGDNLFALVNTENTKESTGRYPEAHKKYIDVQYIVSGEEYIGYSPLKNQKIQKEYNPEKDIMFFCDEPSFIKFEEGMFAVFFPDDLHMPGIKIENSTTVKKIVIKVII
jgi:YhcH/YjgK/YiaL family protein